MTYTPARESAKSTNKVSTSCSDFLESTFPTCISGTLRNCRSIKGGKVGTKGLTFYRDTEHLYKGTERLPWLETSTKGSDPSAEPGKFRSQTHASTVDTDCRRCRLGWNRDSRPGRAVGSAPDDGLFGTRGKKECICNADA